METEETTQRVRKLVTYYVDAIEAPVHLMRGQLDQLKIKELSESIEQNGLINPLTVVNVNGHIELVAGFRRLMAVKLLRWQTVECSLIESKDLECEIIKIHENLVRENVDPISEGVYYASIIEKYGMKQKDLARIVGVSDAYISERLGTQGWPVILKNAVMSDQIAFSSARELARIKDQAVFEHYFRTGMENGISPSVAKEWANYANTLPDAAPIGNDERSEDYAPRVIQMPSFACQSCACMCEVQEMQMIRVCSHCAKAFREGLSQDSGSNRNHVQRNPHQLDLLENPPR